MLYTSVGTLWCGKRGTTEETEDTWRVAERGEAGEAVGAEERGEAGQAEGADTERRGGEDDDNEEGTALARGGVGVGDTGEETGDEMRTKQLRSV